MGFAKDNGIKAICFDIDGTLYKKWKMDLRIAYASVLHLPFAIKYNKLRQQIRKEDGYQNLPQMSYDEISSRGAVFFFGTDSCENRKRFREKEKRVFHDSYLRSYRNIKPAKSVAEVLMKAKAQGLRMAALSDFPIGVKLQAMGLDKYFEFAISSEDIGHFKPSGTPFKALQEHLGLNANEILYVGDSYRKDILGAKRLGMRACLVFSNKVNEYTEADLVVPSWKVLEDKVLEP